MIRLLIALTCVCAIVVGCVRLTEKQGEQLKHEAGDAVSSFGIPRSVGELAVGLGLLFAGHKNGRRRERKARENVISVATKAASDG